jgi:signal peptidase II
MTKDERNPSAQMTRALDARRSGSASSSSGLWHSFVITLLLYALDQLTKWLVLRRIELNDSHPVIRGFFDLVHVHNTGAAFGSFHNSNLLFTLLSFVTLCVLAVCAWRGLFYERWTRLGVALLSAGVLGNLTDRLLRHHVVDFLDFYVGDHHWPAFNVADSCICVAAAIFILSSLREKQSPETTKG